MNTIELFHVVEVTPDDKIVRVIASCIGHIGWAQRTLGEHVHLQVNHQSAYPIAPGNRLRIIKTVQPFEFVT